jgi:hypothetical protein
LGRPLSTEVLSGERADEGLYRPSIERIRGGWQPPGLLFVGDGKRSALDTRASLAGPQDWSLAPLPLTGATAGAMDAWSTGGVTKGKAGELPQRWRTNDRGHEVLAAEGYAFERPWHAPGRVEAWSARGLGVRSPMHATQQAAGLEKRLRHAEP